MQPAPGSQVLIFPYVKGHEDHLSPDLQQNCHVGSGLWSPSLLPLHAYPLHFPALCPTLSLASTAFIYLKAKASTSFACSHQPVAALDAWGPPRCDLEVAPCPLPVFAASQSQVGD
jgi:hypothetical protein